MDHIISDPPDDLGELADVIDEAATVIAVNGLHSGGDYWPDAWRTEWEPGVPCCTAGGIGIALGYRTQVDITDQVACIETGTEAAIGQMHPAFAAVMHHLGMSTPTEVFDWSDSCSQDTVIDTLRDCAGRLRTAVTDGWPVTLPLATSLHLLFAAAAAPDLTADELEAVMPALAVLATDAARLRRPTAGASA